MGGGEGGKDTSSKLKFKMAIHISTGKMQFLGIFATQIWKTNLHHFPASIPLKFAYELIKHSGIERTSDIFGVCGGEGGLPFLLTHPLPFSYNFTSVPDETYFHQLRWVKGTCPPPPSLDMPLI